MSILPWIFLALAVLLGIAGFFSDRREAAQQRAFEKSALAARLRDSGTSAAGLPDPPPGYTPYILAGTLVALGFFLVSAFWGSGTITDKIADCAECSFTMPKAAAAGDTVTAALASTDTAVLNGAALYLDGSQTSTHQVVSPSTKGPGQSIWFLKPGEGKHRVSLFVPAAGNLVSHTFKNGEGGTDVDVGGCKVTVPAKPANNETYAIDIAGCDTRAGMAQVKLNGTAVSTNFGLLKDGNRMVDRWIATAAATPRRIDVIVPDSTSAAAFRQYDLIGKKSATLTDVNAFITATLGALTALAGFIAALINAFKRTTTSPPA
jgi:hypothetical protein